MTISKNFKILLIIIGSIGLITTAIVVPVVLFRVSTTQGIEILSDEDFRKYNLPGTGTSSDPYIIENHEISPRDALNGIHIMEVTKYFIIRNCIIEPANEIGGFRGISIRSVSDDIAIIKNNTIRNCAKGIYVYNTEGVTIEDNSIYYSKTNGIEVTEESDYSIIRNNYCESNLIGIYLLDSPRSLVERNVCNRSKDSGILVVESSYTDVFNNTFLKTGFSYGASSLSIALSYDVEDNIVNERKLEYLKELENTMISTDEYGQLKLVGCTNVILKNLDIRKTNLGISLLYCETCTIKDSTFSENYLVGISVHRSTDIIIDNITCNDNIGYYVGELGYDNSDGIYVRSSDFITIKNCKIRRNQDNGIFMYNVWNSSVQYNILNDNREHGLFLWYSHGNSIHHNSFIDNTRYISADSQGFEDDGTDNYWYDTSTNQGNYWDDWISGYYFIEGFFEFTNSDNYPLSMPPVR